MASRKILVDASALYAFVDRSDNNHTQVVKIMEQFSLSNIQLFTTIQAIQDTYGVIGNQLGLSLSYEFLQVITESNMEILFPQKTDLMSAFRLLKVNRNKQIPLKEALTATLMQKRGIFQILTFNFWHNLLGSESYLSKY